MSQLYFAPASNTMPVSIPTRLKQETENRWSPHDDSIEEWTPYENLKATVLSPICSSDKIGLPIKYDLAPIWGLAERSIKNCQRKIQKGDYIIFYSGNSNFPYIAKVDMVMEDIKLGKTLWPYYKLNENRGGEATGEAQSYILYLDTVWYADIPMRTIQQLRHSRDVTIRGFSAVPSNRLNRLRKSTTEIVDEVTGSIRSVAIKQSPYMRKHINRTIAKHGPSDKLLSIACRANNIDSTCLSQSAKKDIINCLTEIYAK